MTGNRVKKAPAGSVRVRYAPSPTGEPHLGNIRTALFNWIFARNRRGAFIVRIEDTDQARLVEGSELRIFEALQWLGLDWDEGPGSIDKYGPYVQSERIKFYREHVDFLLDRGSAYYCYCTVGRLDGMRKDQQSRKVPPGYDARCRELTSDEREAARIQNPDPVVRFKMPLGGTIVVDDAIRGEVEFKSALLDDFVILKTDGFPTYHLASVVDDHLMEISHVIRGEEWLPSLPKHYALYQAFGYSVPTMVHLPMILGPDRSKLSKRHGATSILEYREEGYLPDAIVNFMALLGWSLDDHTDVLSRDTLVEKFGLERILQSAAIFNLEKLNWFNGVYIRNLEGEELAKQLAPWFEAQLPADVPRPLDFGYICAIVPLVHERLKKMSEAIEVAEFFFVKQPRYNPLDVIQRGMARDDTKDAIEKVTEAVELISEWDTSHIEASLRALSTDLDLKTSQLFGLIRVAITGKVVAPPLFATMEVLGKNRCMERLKFAEYLIKAIPIAC